MNRSIARSVDHRSLVGAVADDLVQWLREGHVPVGGQLPTMPVLMEEFQVGRSTIREAVKSLAYAGLLEVTPGRGTFLIAHPDSTESWSSHLRRAEDGQLDDLRRTLEAQIARFAATRRTAKELKAIESAFEACREQAASGDAAKVAEADFQFHMAICAAAKHDLYTFLYRGLREVVRDNVKKRAPSDLAPVLKGVSSNHGALLEAIRDRDVEAAEAVWTDAHDCLDPKG
ncbi:FadR/GntR family transcriptional regulator [Nocardioides sp. L-11A]|uniref:FadR/GntR family transcriptional regulator n=1 Tax=Nocardioides sp. L-11A TaxID=3043848 RepID=UPI00249BC78E|nr:FCD domain-containing protein [Nocardioides sp. L-11A]